MVEKEECFFIYRKRNKFIILPKYQLKNTEEIMLIKEIFEYHLDTIKLNFI